MWPSRQRVLCEGSTRYDAKWTYDLVTVLSLDDLKPILLCRWWTSDSSQCLTHESWSWLLLEQQRLTCQTGETIRNTEEVLLLVRIQVLFHKKLKVCFSFYAYVRVSVRCTWRKFGHQNITCVMYTLVYTCILHF